MRYLGERTLPTEVKPGCWAAGWCGGWHVQGCQGLWGPWEGLAWPVSGARATSD